jgi:hypothetical protein
MAASKKPAPGKAVAPRQNTQVALGSWRDRVKDAVSKQREIAAALPAQTGNFLSFQGGTITHGGNELDNPLPVIILAVGKERSYFINEYDPDNGTPPDCYSYDGEAPHENASTPQSDRCKTCQFNQFNSARQGSGKGCKEGGKLAMIHADTIETQKSALASPIVLAKVSTLNSKTLRSYVDGLGDVPVWADVTEIQNKPDKKKQYSLTFVKQGVALEDEILDAVSSRIEEAEKLMDQPYPEPKEKAPARGKAAVRKNKFSK